MYCLVGISGDQETPPSEMEANLSQGCCGSTKVMSAYQWKLQWVSHHVKKYRHISEPSRDVLALALASLLDSSETQLPMSVQLN